MSILCLIALYASAHTIFSVPVNPDMYDVLQAPPTAQNPQKNVNSNKKVVRIERAKKYFRRDDGSDIQVLKDSVVLFHDGAFLYCDSAYLNQNANTFEAFDNVRMEQGDTIFLYGKYMHYDGNTKLVKVRDDVSLEHTPQKVTLFTDSLNYDRMMNLGYYFDGGMLVDSLNELTSFWGQYEPSLNMATFKDSVILTNPKFQLFSDQLKYNTAEKRALISTPTRIVSDSGIIYTSKGWYNTETEESLLLDQSTVVNKEGDRILRGDTIYYYKEKGYGEVFGNMFLQDTAKKVILTGHYGYYNEIEDWAFATDSAVAIEYSQTDSLYLHGDTLRLLAVMDTVIQKRKPKLLGLPILETDSTDIPMLVPEMDSTAFETDSVMPMKPVEDINVEMDTIITVQRLIKAYYGVRFYRSDIQGVCDSLQFSSKDSVLHMYREPVLWNTNRQLSGDTIDIFMNDSTIDYMHVKRSAFSIEDKDSIHFNQLKSRSLKVFFEDRKAKRVTAEGDLELMTYPEDKGELNGIQIWLEGSYLEVLLNDGKLDKAIIRRKSDGEVRPFHLLKDEQLRLKDFFWFDYLRPLDKDDILRKVTKKASDKKPPRPAIFDREE
ncbi:MAG: OstA-like protein [Dysgonomonas sp.]|nr:OstA-like protein [Dysgonomonas sp.]